VAKSGRGTYLRSQTINTGLGNHRRGGSSYISTRPSNSGWPVGRFGQAASASEPASSK